MVNKHLYWLDWVRFTAALMVVACHARGYTWAQWNELDPHDHTKFAETFFILTENGNEWVVAFFVLSGFLVGGKVIERSLAQTFDPWAFAVDRITRIWVPLIPALVLTTGVALYCGFPILFAVLLGNFFSLQGIFCDIFGNNVPLWSLSYEVWFYILTGVAALIVMRPKTHRLWLWLGLAASLAAFTKLWPVFLSCWLIGAFSYFLSSGKKSTGLGLFGLFLALLGICLFKMYEDPGPIDDYLHAWLPSPNIAWLIESLGLGIFFADICHREPHSPLMMRFERFGTSLAAFSYTLYLTHYPILLLWERISSAPRYPHIDAVSFLVFLCKIGATLLGAWLLYLPFESQTPTIRKWLKKRFVPLACNG